ncbi:MAG TPA: amidohydrolase family protein [Gammaproteobacteria bacterium]|nr:amidohydrolase family protein [Gammaproteobacteria bacterium]
MTIDCHAHIFSADTERYPVAPLGGTLRAGELDDPVTAERLLQMLDANGVERAVVVQRAYIYGYDNAYVVEAAAKYPQQLRAVCAIDPEADDAPQTIRHWVEERGAIGIRLTEPSRGAGTGWLDSPQALAAWETATELGIPVRLHFFRWNRESGLPVVAGLLERFPRTQVVIDHLSNLAVEQGPPDYGLDAPLAALIPYANLSLLLSTINLGRLAADGKPSAPVVARLVEAFGAERIMWGSDIGQSQGTYAEMRALAEEAVATLPDRERRLVLDGTGHVVYGQ